MAARCRGTKDEGWGGRPDRTLWLCRDFPSPTLLGVWLQGPLTTLCSPSHT